MIDPTTFWKVYPLNLDGVNPANFVADEMLSVTLAYPVVMMDYAPFYEEGLVVRDFYGNLLVKGTDYDICRTTLNVDKTLRSGKPVYHSLEFYKLITNTDVFVSYYCYGGEELSSSRVPYNTIQRVNNELATIDYDDILGKPERFPTHSSTHWGHSSELTSCGVLVTALNEFNAALAAYWAKRHNDSTSPLIGTDMSAFQANVQMSIKRLQAHTVAQGNVHRVSTPPFVTAAYLDAYYPINVASKLDQAVALNDEVAVALDDRVALDAMRWEGKTREEVIAYLKSNIPANLVVMGQFSSDKVGDKPDGECYLDGEGKWKSVSELKPKTYFTVHVNNQKWHIEDTEPFDDGIEATLEVNKNGVDVGDVISFQYRIQDHGIGLYRALRTPEGWMRIG